MQRELVFMLADIRGQAMFPIFCRDKQYPAIFYSKSVRWEVSPLKMGKPETNKTNGKYDFCAFYFGLLCCNG